jgi:hypothetical protein
MVRDELTGWVRSLDQYRGGRGADRQFFLSAWSGEPLKVDRKSSGAEPLVVTDPVLSVVGCVPPALLSELDAGHGGEDGFLDRVLFVIPRPFAGRRWSWEGLSPETRQGWHDAVARLYDLPMGVDASGRPAAVVVDLAPEAYRLWEDWYNRHQQELEAADFPDVLKGPWSKLVAYAARFALILHMLRGACGEDVGDDVDAESLARAFRLVAYFKSHARAVYARLLQSDKSRQVARAIAWIRAHGGPVRPTDLTRNNVAGVETRSQAVALMKELEDRGHGRCEIRVSGNRVKTTWFTARRAGR